MIDFDPEIPAPDALTALGRKLGMRAARITSTLDREARNAAAAYDRAIANAGLDYDKSCAAAAKKLADDLEGIERRRVESELIRDTMTHAQNLFG